MIDAGDMGKISEMSWMSALLEEDGWTSARNIRHRGNLCWSAAVWACLIFLVWFTSCTSIESSRSIGISWNNSSGQISAKGPTDDL